MSRGSERLAQPQNEPPVSAAVQIPFVPTGVQVEAKATVGVRLAGGCLGAVIFSAPYLAVGTIILVYNPWWLDWSRLAWVPFVSCAVGFFLVQPIVGMHASRFRLPLSLFARLSVGLFAMNFAYVAFAVASLGYFYVGTIAVPWTLVGMFFFAVLAQFVLSNYVRRYRARRKI